MTSRPSTFASQLLDWLQSCRVLSGASAAAYRGEVNRLGEFMASRGILGVQDMEESHWLDYLQALMSDRSAVASRRRGELKVTSALQAARITRLFLRHSYARGWIRWVPLGSRQCRVETRVPQAAMSEELIDLLLGPSPAKEDEARALAAISLAFWGALNPREIAVARECDLKARGEWAELRVAGRTDSVILPRTALRQLSTYHEIRREQLGSTQGQSRSERTAPLVSQLGTLASVTPHRVWTLLKCWPPEPRNGQVKFTLGARVIRGSFLELASRHAACELAEVRRQAGRLDHAALRRCQFESASTAEHVVDRIGRNLESLRQTRQGNDSHPEH